MFSFWYSLGSSALLSLVWPRSSCDCYCSSDPSQAVLDILERQLQRCGPEHLTCPAATCSPCAAPWLAWHLIALFVAGVWCGFLLAHRLAVLRLPAPSSASTASSSSPRQSSPVAPLDTSSSASLTDRRGPLTPAAKRALLKNGE